MARLQEAIDKDPQGFMADRLRLLLADTHLGRQQIAFLVQPVDLARGLAEYDAYLAIIQQLASSDNPEVRFEAAVRLTHVVTHEQLTEVFNELNGQSVPLQPVEPVIECVTFNRLNHRPTEARFGYNNPNSTAVTLAIGEKNRFKPGPTMDQGQPTTFLSGEHPSAFTISAPKGTYLPSELTWTLDGQEAAITPDAPACGR